MKILILAMVLCVGQGQGRVRYSPYGYNGRQNNDEMIAIPNDFGTPRFLLVLGRLVELTYHTTLELATDPQFIAAVDQALHPEDSGTPHFLLVLGRLAELTYHTTLELATDPQFIAAVDQALHPEGRKLFF